MKNFFSHPVRLPAALRNDAGALIYAVKSFAAAMLAYYIALSIGLERPSWAIITVYIVSQTSVGASLSRSLYRLAGTVAGASATVLIVPTFANRPILCSAVLTGWIAFCLWLSLLERTPRAYAFVLAGYTASLIGFPAVSDPGGIFNVAIVRVQEIAIGIFCAALIHRYVLPARVSGQFNAKLSQTLQAARGRVADTLAGKPDAASGPLHLALVLQFLQGISHHIPYDFALSAPARQARKAIHDRLARLVIVNCELHDRLPAFGTLPPTCRRCWAMFRPGLPVRAPAARQRRCGSAVRFSSIGMPRRRGRLTTRCRSALFATSRRPSLSCSSASVFPGHPPRQTRFWREANPRGERLRFPPRSAYRRPHGAGGFRHHSERLSGLDLLSVAGWRYGGLYPWRLLHALWQLRYPGTAHREIHHWLVLGRGH